MAISASNLAIWGEIERSERLSARSILILGSPSHSLTDTSALHFPGRLTHHRPIWQGVVSPWVKFCAWWCLWGCILGEFRFDLNNQSQGEVDAANVMALAMKAAEDLYNIRDTYFPSNPDDKISRLQAHSDLALSPLDSTPSELASASSMR
ncbi:hypothetical protein RHMOL_Rhmol04G0087500 [Rhododendron molle]|uniref:Uncharacterized protein n=1 Tax=Rhododendron molle TaxID=49168 RepID=A0ACC0NZP9_RHOML|nr:hypothetical protein RHMOL_Rhmol04G0087500 [Rhododendron molle]